MDLTDGVIVAAIGAGGTIIAALIGFWGVRRSHAGNRGRAPTPLGPAYFWRLADFVVVRRHRARELRDDAGRRSAGKAELMAIGDAVSRRIRAEIETFDKRFRIPLLVAANATKAASRGADVNRLITLLSEVIELVEAQMALQESGATGES